MVIAYLIDYDIKQTSGVVQKILQQSQKWIDMGHTVYFISAKTLTIYNEKRKMIFQQEPLRVRMGRFGTAISLLYSSYVLDKVLKQISFDILYMRYRLYMPFLAKVLKKYKVVMEINSDDTIEYKLHSYLTHFYNKFTRDLVLKHINGFVSVSFELRDRFVYLQKDIEVIANGIDTSECTVENHKNNKPSFVFIGTPRQSWHGLDKILQMASYFQEYEFYIIGMDDKEANNVKYFGYLNKEEATKIIQKSDIGIGTLSLHKTGLSEASPLKSRHYLACGLPIIYGYNDTDLDPNESFALQLGNHEENLDYSKIREFVKFVFNNQDVREKARLFAKDTLDYKKKEERRINYFKKVLDEK